MKERILHPENFGESSRSSLTPEQIENFSFLIHEASYAEAYPDQSGFYVRTAGMTKDGTLHRGGNKEFALSDAFIHGETAVVSGLRDETDSPIEAIAWYKDGPITPNDFGRPCGNCRDVLRKYCTPETYLLNGNENAFVYLQLKDYLFERYHEMRKGQVHGIEVNAAVLAAKWGTNIYLPDEMKPHIYGAVLVSEDGTIWPGEQYSNVGYDSITPILSSIVSWKNSYPKGLVSEKHLRLSRVVVASESGIPDVFYRDRQALLEQDEILRRHTKLAPIQVELVHANRDQYGNLFIHEVRSTNSEEWLPGPFTPGVFRMDDVIDAQLQKLIGKR